MFNYLMLNVMKTVTRHYVRYHKDENFCIVFSSSYDFISCREFNMKKSLPYTFLMISNRVVLEPSSSNGTMLPKQYNVT